MRRFIIFSIPFILVFLLLQTADAQQQLTSPRVSQAASVTQRVGLTDITIKYHRPGVNGREIWGKLVPYNTVWRAGANENTTITFSDPVKIQGKELPAGTYGLHMIPTENDRTIIFSNNSWSWGSFFYDEKEDALRITVKPVPSENEEWLSYNFENPSRNSVTAILRWEKLSVPFTIDLDVDKIVLNHYQKELDNAPGFTWQAWNQAANYALQNNTSIDEALQWADHSIQLNRNFQNLWTKAGLTEKKGLKDDADKIRGEAMLIATEIDINNLGYQYLFAKEIDKAIETFQKNVKDHPDSWNVYDSLGEGYAAKGERKLAKENYSKAFKMVKDDTNKKRIGDILKGLESE
ncbi:MAG TPA: DUF2911 domain-containing protein [Ignavibacteriaceae bacterium]|nr:DUF2911 domain-containing protein [Ignavibacteriaceae bacterium]